MKKNSECRICKGKRLTQFLSLGAQPPANRFIKKEDIALPEPQYPLDVYFCADCRLVQLLDVVDKEELFSNYIYFSSGMPKLSNHFKAYADDIIARFCSIHDFVMEIASNDGILLKHFQDAGFRVLGVDPATNVAALANARSVKTINDFFSEKIATKIAHKEGKPRVIMGNNVVAHIDDHHDLARGLKVLLAEDGIFVMEAPYLVDMFDNLSYDTIYHEHLSYLAITPLKVLFEKFDLEIFEVQLHPVQGQSIRVFVGHTGAHTVSGSVAEFMKKEDALKLGDIVSYEALAKRIEDSKKRLVAQVAALRAAGKRIAAYGAPAKGNTVLNYCKIGAESLEYALEDLPSKQGLYTPRTHIPVISREEAKRRLPDYYLLLAWNYREAIMAKEGAFRAQGGKFILPIGDENQEF